MSKITKLPKFEIIPSETELREDKRFARLPWHASLIKPPFRIYLIGSSGSGKSSVLYTMIKKYYSHYWDIIVFYNGTSDSNTAWEKTSRRNIVILNEFDEADLKEFLQETKDSQNALRAEGKQMKRILIAFDDMIANDLTRSQKTSTLEKALLECRHYNISIAICSQSFMKLSRTARLNVNAIMLFKVARSEIKRIAEEYCTDVGYEDLLEAYNMIRKRAAYNFLTIIFGSSGNRYLEKLDSPILFDEE